MRFLLTLFLAVLAVLVTTANVAQAQTVLKEQQPYSKGEYYAFAQPFGTWSNPELKVGVNVANRIEVTDATFPENTIFKWYAPLTTRGGIIGYNAIYHGWIAGSLPKTPVKASTVGTLGRLRHSYSFTLTKAIGETNVLAETFLYERAGDHGSSKLEVGFFPYAPAATCKWSMSRQIIGPWIDPWGRKWNVGVQTGPFGPFVMFTVPDCGIYTNGGLDFRAAIKWLGTKMPVDPNWIVSGSSFGIEPVDGAGNVELRRFEVTMH